MALDPKLAAKITAIDTADSSFEVQLPKSPNLRLILLGADLQQAAEKHELLTLFFKGIPVDEAISIASGDPVIFTYRRGTESAKFNGYVHSVTQNNTAAINKTTVSCVGASYVMKNTDQKIYKNVTADQVVAKIARKHGFTPITQTHPRKRQSVVQAGLSDWQLLTSLAKQTGYALYASNTSLIFMSKDKLFNDNKANAPYFFYVSEVDAPTTAPGLRMYGSILNYNIDVSDESPESGTVVNRVITGRNQITGELIDNTVPYSRPTSAGIGAVIPGENYFE
jgi:hypothetical protein